MRGIKALLPCMRPAYYPDFDLSLRFSKNGHFGDVEKSVGGVDGAKQDEGGLHLEYQVKNRHAWWREGSEELHRVDGVSVHI